MIAMHKVMFSLEYLDINFTLNNNKNREQKRNHRKELSMYVARSAWKSAKFITETVIDRECAPKYVYKGLPVRNERFGNVF